MNRKRIDNKIIVILILSVLVLFIPLSGCLDSPIELDGVEIREYQGEELSSVQDFRENSINGPQWINREDYTLKITGLINQPKTYTYDEILSRFQSYKKVVRLNCVEGWSVDILWEGILLRDLFENIQPTDKATVVIFHAEDGYTTSMTLDYLIENDILMAYKMNNVTLPVERGFPFQLVAESKWGYKWIKWITEIEVSNNAVYEGYWEQRGFSNTANLNESFFG